MTRGSVEFARLQRTERVMVRIRWAGVVFGVVQALTFYRPYPPGMLFWALAAMFLLAAGNVVVSVTAKRASETGTMRRLAAWALGLDVVAVLGLVYVYTFDPETAIWATTYILPLEGAIRFRLRGALGTMAVVTVMYAAREVYGAQVYGNELLPISISFRMGIGFFIGVVAGSMASNLVHDRRQAEEATARYESMLAAMSHLGEGVAIVDGDRVIYANEALGEIVGYTPAELVELPSLWTLLPSAAFESRTREAPPAEGMRVETSVVHRDGRRVEVEVGLKPVDLDGRPRLVAIVRDITQRKRAEMDLAVAYRREREVVKRLQEQDAAKSDFLATVSHELRTPVTKVVGFAATLMARWEGMDEELRLECVRRIAAGGDQLTRLITELLDFDRLEHGKLLLDLASCSLNEVVEDTTRDLSTTLERHTLAVEVPEDTYVLANREGLGRVLDNLLTNAVNFSPAGSVITVRARPKGAEQVVVEVADEGIGIPPEAQERVFDRFHRLNRDVTAPSGTGIGLAIVKEFVEAQGGRAWASSGASGGAVMGFTLWRPGYFDPQGGPGTVPDALGTSPLA